MMTETRMGMEMTTTTNVDEEVNQSYTMRCRTLFDSVDIFCPLKPHIFFLAYRIVP